MREIRETILDRVSSRVIPWRLTNEITRPLKVSLVSKYEERAVIKIDYERNKEGHTRNFLDA